MRRLSIRQNMHKIMTRPTQSNAIINIVAFFGMVIPRIGMMNNYLISFKFPRTFCATTIVAHYAELTPLIIEKVITPSLRFGQIALRVLSFSNTLLRRIAFVSTIGRTIPTLVKIVWVGVKRRFATMTQFVRLFRHQKECIMGVNRCQNA